MRNLAISFIGRCAGIAGACLLLSLSGCAVESVGGGEAQPIDGVSDESSQPVYAGQDVAELRVGQHSTFKFVDMGTNVALITQGDLEDAAVVEPLMKRVNESRSYAEVYRAVAPDVAVPDSVLLLDAKYANASRMEAEAEAAPPEVLSESAVASSALSASAAPGPKTQSHANPAFDATINWTDDCTWFLNISPNSCDERWSATSMLWAFSGDRESRQHWAILMAASHTYGTDVTAQEWNGSAWVNIYTAYIQPRHYVTLNYGTSTSAKKWRHFRNTGRGGSLARTHSHVGWNIQAPSGDFGQACFHDYLCHSPQG
jgi:hypothetical protein